MLQYAHFLRTYEKEIRSQGQDQIEVARQFPD